MPTVTDDALTTERLVQRVKAGDADAVPLLWESVRRFAHQQAHRVFVLSHGRGGMEQEDLEQTAFLALRPAAETYDSAAGASFLTWYKYHIQNAFADAGGWRTSRINPLDYAASLDTPITVADGDESDTAYVDVLPDSGAQEALQSVEDTIFVDELHDALDAAIDRHLSPRTAEVVRRLYWGGEQQTQVAADLGISSQAVAAQHQRGLRDLRLSSSARELGQFLYDGWHGTGLAVFQRRGMSSVEWAVVQREKLRGGG